MSKTTISKMPDEVETFFHMLLVGKIVPVMDSELKITYKTVMPKKR